MEPRRSQAKDTKLTAIGDPITLAADPAISVVASRKRRWVGTRGIGSRKVTIGRTHQSRKQDLRQYFGRQLWKAIWTHAGTFYRTQA